MHFLYFDRFLIGLHNQNVLCRKLVHDYKCHTFDNFYNMLDMSAYNGYVLWTAVNPNWNNKLLKRRKFLDELEKSVIQLHRSREHTSLGKVASIIILIWTKKELNESKALKVFYCFIFWKVITSKNAITFRGVFEIGVSLFTFWVFRL